MATLRIPWADGNGNIILTYTGQGNGTVTVQSDTDNLGDDRSQTLTFKTVGANPVTVQVVVIQPTGMQILRDDSGEELRTSNGLILRVLPVVNP
jgi:hypothetical protein